MKKIKQVNEIIGYNIKSLLIFEFFYKVLSFLIFSPLFLKSFTWIMNITGFKYLTLENVVSFITKPITLILLVILILFLLVYTMFDITTIIIILDASYHKKKIKLMDALSLSIKKCRETFNIRNIPLAILVLFIIPFLNLGVSSSFISTIKIPEFILDFIIQNKVLLSILIVFTIILALILLRWLYAIHYYVIENKNFREARKSSISLGKKNHLKDLIALFIIQLSLGLFVIIIILLGILIIYLINNILSKIIIIKSILNTIIGIFIGIIILIFTLLATPVSYAAISCLFYFHKNDKKEKFKPIDIKIDDSKKRKSIFNKIVIGLIILGVIGGVIFTYGIYKGKYSLNIELQNNIEITAHRGASLNYPENTMISFIKAKELGAQWIELDVQQTKDQEIIVIHDTNFKRTTGVNKNTWELTYPEIYELDAGIFKGDEFKGEHIPLLKDVLVWAKENEMKINIELKPTGHEEDFEKMVVDKINETGCKNQVIVSSQVYNVLENTKDYDKSIKTLYVMSVAVGNIIKLDAADNFSVEASNVNKSLIKKVHNENKELYVWTINTKDSIKKMIDLNVDNIITDNIDIAKELIIESKNSNLINSYLKFIEKVF